jgi:hypothetical protein
MSTEPGNNDVGTPTKHKSIVKQSNSGRSLLDIVQEGISKENATRVNRLVVVGDLTSSNDVQAFINANSEIKNKIEGKLTGVTFIVNKIAFIAAVEGTFDNLIEYLQGITNDNEADHFMTSARVLTSVEDVERMFPIWDVRSRKIPKAEQVNFSSEHLAQTIFETVKYLLLLGAALQGMNKNKCSEFLDSQKREVINSVPTSELISFYSHHSALFPIEEYVKVFYADPVCIDLDGERVFPIEEFIEY